MDEDASRRLFGRRRQANVPGGRPKSYQVKATEEEHARLVILADEQGVSVPRLLLESALTQRAETITERRQLGFELTEVRRLLANLTNNANQVARFANSEGMLPEWASDVALDYATLRPQINAIIEGLSRP